MHDPMTVAFSIKYPWKRKSQFFPDGYRDEFMTIWHVDPEKDGTDDSCGWFMRRRHGDKDVYNKIKEQISFEWSYGDDDKFGLFDKDGNQKFSNISIALHLYRVSAGYFFGKGNKPNHKKADKYMRKNLYDIITFSEGDIDSLSTVISNKYNVSKEERVENMASIIYGWLLRTTRPWYKHPRWHIHHWKINIIPIQNFKRWAFSRCCKCGKGFKWGYAPTSNNWDGKGPSWFKGERDVFHNNCNCPYDGMEMNQ